MDKNKIALILIILKSVRVKERSLPFIGVIVAEEEDNIGLVKSPCVFCH